MTARHLTSTKLVHGALAVLVAVQLVSSLILQVPEENHPETVFFERHRAGDFAAARGALMFWGLMLCRTLGTDAGLLMPWFSSARRSAFARDGLQHLRAMRQGHFAQYREASSFPAGLQGLGLISAMAATGLTYTLAQGNGLRGAALLAHGLMANLVWAFLIGQALMALLHHYAGEQDLADIWSLGDPHSHHEGTLHES